MIKDDTGDIYGFDRNNSSPINCVLIDVTLMGKALIVDFLLMHYKSSCNGIIERDWMIPMEAVSSSRYQCIKLLHLGSLKKVCINQWGLYVANENPLNYIKICKAVRNMILTGKQKSSDNKSKIQLVYHGMFAFRIAHGIKDFLIQFKSSTHATRHIDAQQRVDKQDIQYSTHSRLRNKNLAGDVSRCLAKNHSLPEVDYKIKRPTSGVLQLSRCLANCCTIK